MKTSLPALSETVTPAQRFAAHLTDTQRIFLCSDAKTAPLGKTLRADLPRYEFYQPSPTFCRALVTVLVADAAESRYSIVATKAKGI